MNKSILAAVSALALAALMPVDARAVTPVYTWTGCYVGVHAGYGSGRTDMNSTNVYFNGFEMAKFNVDGALGGGQLGCNYQLPATNWVFGIDGSMSAASIKGTGLDAYTLVSPIYDTVKVNRLSSLTGRVGWNGWNPQLLVYAKAGFAWAKLDYVNNYPMTPQYSGNQTRTGWTAGLGAEWMFAPRWSVFLEYAHYDFGTKDMVDIYGNPPFPIKQTVETVKAGVNFRLLP
jgi:outer membrane immunogenic protein